MQVRFVRREEMAPGIWQYYFRPERKVDFIPGQYADFHMLTPLDDPRGQSRVFTLTSLPADELVSFVVKFVEPLSNYKRALENLRPGDTMRIDDAMGDLVLPKLPTIPLVFVAGGIGIASFVSMLRSLNAPRDIQLFYALRYASEKIYDDILSLHTKPNYFVAPNRLTAKSVTQGKSDDTQYYLSGSERFVEGLRHDLEALGVPHEQIVFDYFDGYSEL